jgi:RNA polymerase sigma-70 factor, ECF subfamily
MPSPLLPPTSCAGRALARGSDGAAPSGADLPAGSAPTSEFDRIYDEQFPMVWRLLRAFGVSASALDDAAQDVFLVVHRRLPDFDGRSSIRTWIYGITEHVAFNHRRQVQRKQGPLTSLDGDHATDDPGPHERLLDREMAAFVQGFLDALDPSQRILFVLVLVEQVPAPEVAKMLGIPLNTAYTRIRAIKQAFRKAAAARQEREP